MALSGAELGALLDSGADLSKVDLRRARLKGVDLRGRDLHGLNLTGANLADADLTQARLAGADLSGAKLTGARLDDADLSGADLKRARLKGASLTGANLDGAQMQRLALSDVRLDRATLRGADLTEADFAQGRIEGADLSGAQLLRATFDGATLKGVCLNRAELEEAYLERASLEDVDLSEIKGHRLNLVQARMRRPTFTGARLTDADMAEVSIEDGAFTDADLTNAVLDQATLTRVSFTGASVKGTDLQGVTGLGPEDLEALRARGATIHALALSKLIDALVASRVFRALAVAALLIGAGSFFYYYTRPTQQPMDAVLEEARALRASNHADSALALYDGLLADTRGDKERETQLQYLRAETLMELDRNDEASEIYRQLAETSQGNKDEAVNAKLRLVSVQIDGGSFDEAIPALEAIADDPETAPADVARALVAMSTIYERMGFPDKAIDVAEQALQKYPDRPVVALQVNRHIAALLIQRKEFDRAEKILRELDPLVHDDSDRAELLISRARLYDEMGDQPRSLEVITQLARDYPDNPEVTPEVRCELASLLAEQGELEKAQHILQVLVDGGGSGAVAHQAAISLARLEASLGRNLKALDLLRQLGDAPGMSPEDLGLARMAEAEIEARLGKRTEALAVLAAIAAQPELGQVAPALLMEAQLQQELGDYPTAEKTYEQILARFSGVPDMVVAARMGLAAILEKQGRFADAEGLYRGLLATATTGDDRAHIYERLGGAQLSRGDTAAARETWQTLQKEIPEGEAQARARFGLAQVATASGDVEGAVKLYREAADLIDDPELQAIALQSLAQLYLDRGRDDDAKLVFQEIVDRAGPGQEAAFSARMGLAGIYARRKEVDQAYKIYRAAIDGTPLAEHQAEGLLAIGRLQVESGALTDAEATFSQVQERFSTRPESVDAARLGLAQLRRLKGDDEAAAALYRAVAESSEDPATASSALQELAAMLEAQGRTAEAQAIQKQILQRFGDDPEASFQAHLSAAAAQAANGDPDGAVKAYTDMLATTSDAGLKMQVLDGLARSQQQIGDLDGASRSWEALIGLAGDSPDFRDNALMGLASLRIAQDRRDDARALYRQVAEESPDKGLQAWALQGQAQLVAEAGDAAQAQKMYEDILDRFEDDPQVTAGARLSLGQLLRANDDLSGARAQFEAVAKTATDPSQKAWGLLNLAQVRIEQGEDSDGLDGLMILIREHPEDPEVVLEARLSLANLYRSRGRSQEAEQAYKEVAGGGGFPDYRITALEGLAGLAMDAGKPDEAKATYEQILSRFGANPEAAYNARLGMARVDLSRGPDGAKAAAEALAKLVPTAQDPVLKAWGLQSLAQAYVAIGDQEHARATYKQLLEEDGGMADLAQEARNWLDRM